ncbi:MAG TPA: DNA mismatch repair protein MutS [Planctomycetota bacterium]|nr:DNA mismatch repair protein MutS [Planctomycetota bacterium]
MALARWLLGAPDPAPETAAFDAAAIRARQQAVAALSPESELRERLALTGDELASGKPSDLDPRALRAWSAAEPMRFSAVERGTAVALGGLAAAAAATWAAGITSFLPLLVVATAEAVFAQALKRRMRCVDRLAESGEHPLSLLSQLLSLLEERARRPSPPAALAELGAAVGVSAALASDHAARPASADIARFGSLARSVASARRNGVYALFAFLLQIRVHRAHALERWRVEVGPALSRWLDAVGEFEALLALAGYAHEHPDDVFPDIVSMPSLQASGLGHPLLPEANCVRNDVALDSRHALLLISGSNMSGKSTLLRAVGLAVVIGQAGAPVRARTLRFSPVQVGACISIHDSLRDGSSRFWAEITRLRAIDDVARGGRPLIFLLDELLSGTNSHDRLLGARAVLRQLLAHGAIGIVTTHDLALAQLADELSPLASNAHFEDGLQDGRMVFDYRMRPGVVERGNALALMRSLGLLGDAGESGTAP